ncbi:MAG: 3-methyl-2-oxobutanoate hydroxymethyltransferase [Candidatus Cloacimonetes bacterium]|nr:3-methyl-2-oxobutanoate hydroxymethyltransferase [Candidatus Cloacimonadota bacterium]
MQNIQTYLRMKQERKKIVMITAYDYPAAKFVQEAGADMILVGDSLGMVVLGYTDTIKVTLADIIHHTRAARRGAGDTFIVADMPYLSYHLDLISTKRNAARLLVEGGANAVKLEGGKESRLEAIRAIRDIEIPVVAHLGLTPQSINSLGGYRVQGTTDRSYREILAQALAIQDAGAFLLVLEGIPEKLGKEITEKLDIPTIGIGAGRFTDGQVLVYHDLLGLADIRPKFVKVYGNLHERITENLQSFIMDVRSGSFPAQENVYYPIENEGNK